MFSYGEAPFLRAEVVAAQRRGSARSLPARRGDDAAKRERREPAEVVTRVERTKIEQRLRGGLLDVRALIVEHLAEGRLLPRDRDEIAMHAHRFVLAIRGGRVVACAELAPLSRDVAEVRSQLARELAALRSVEVPDLPNVISRLTALEAATAVMSTVAPIWMLFHVSRERALACSDSVGPPSMSATKRSRILCDSIRKSP